MIGDDLTVCMGGLIDGIDILLEKIKVCTFIECDDGACFGYIVKRRYVWKLPGVLGFTRNVRAQSQRNHVMA